MVWKNKTVCTQYTTAGSGAAIFLRECRAKNHTPLALFAQECYTLAIKGSALPAGVSPQKFQR
jgi:hypothetical protein